MPLAKIIHSFDQDAMALWNANFEEGLQIAKATHAKEVWSARGNMPPSISWAAPLWVLDADNSVTNSYGQTHEVPNLYVAGPGIFATAGASNPTYTILALSREVPSNWRASGARSRADTVAWVERSCETQHPCRRDCWVSENSTQPTNGGRSSSCRGGFGTRPT